MKLKREEVAFMIVCENCLMSIEYHEGDQYSRQLSSYEDSDKAVYGDYDDKGNFIKDDYANEAYVLCDCCGDYVVIDEAYEI